MWLESLKVGDVEFVEIANVDLIESERMPDHSHIPIDIPSVTITNRESSVTVKIKDEYKHVNKFVDFFDDNWNIYTKKYYDSDFDENGQMVIIDHRIPRVKTVTMRVCLDDYAAKIEKEYWLSINLDLDALPVPTIDSFLELKLGDVDYKSLGNTDVTDQVMEYLNGGLPGGVIAQIEYVTDTVLMGLSVKLKEDFESYYISFMDTYDSTYDGEYTVYTDVYPEGLIALFENLLIEYETPYEEFSHMVIIVSDVPLEDILDGEINPNDASIKAFGVCFKSGDGGNTGLEPEQGPELTPVIQDLDSELFIKLAGKWFRLVDKDN